MGSGGGGECWRRAGAQGTCTLNTTALAPTWAAPLLVRVGLDRARHHHGAPRQPQLLLALADGKRSPPEFVVVQRQLALGAGRVGVQGQPGRLQAQLWRGDGAGGARGEQVAAVGTLCLGACPGRWRAHQAHTAQKEGLTRGVHRLKGGPQPAGAVLGADRLQGGTEGRRAGSRSVGHSRAACEWGWGEGWGLATPAASPSPLPQQLAPAGPRGGRPAWRPDPRPRALAGGPAGR